MLFVEGQFKGGLQQMRDYEKQGGLAQIIPFTEIEIGHSLKIKGLIAKSRFIVFLRGNPDFPDCPTSKRMMKVLKKLQLP